MEKFLPTLVKHSQEATIYVADNASTDDSVSFIKDKFPNVKVIVNASNGGYAKGYNDALKQLDSEYFVLINSDIEVTEGWLPPIINLMDSDKNISALQPKLLDYNKRNIDRANWNGNGQKKKDKNGNTERQLGNVSKTTTLLKKQNRSLKLLEKELLQVIIEAESKKGEYFLRPLFFELALFSKVLFLCRLLLVLL